MWIVNGPIEIIFQGFELKLWTKNIHLRILEIFGNRILKPDIRQEPDLAEYPLGSYILGLRRFESSESLRWTPRNIKFEHILSLLKIVFNVFA